MIFYGREEVALFEISKAKMLHGPLDDKSFSSCKSFNHGFLKLQGLSHTPKTVITICPHLCVEEHDSILSEISMQLSLQYLLKLLPQAPFLLDAFVGAQFFAACSMCLGNI